MNLKKKLALDAAIKSGLTDATSRNNYREGYLAGFEKAREMAIELALKWNRHDFDKLKGSSFYNDLFLYQRISFTAELNQLGEEEVKE